MHLVHRVLFSMLLSPLKIDIVLKCVPDESGQVILKPIFHIPREYFLFMAKHTENTKTSDCRHCDFSYW